MARKITRCSGQISIIYQSEVITEYGGFFEFFGGGSHGFGNPRKLFQRIECWYQTGRVSGVERFWHLSKSGTTGKSRAKTTALLICFAGRYNHSVRTSFGKVKQGRS